MTYSVLTDQKILEVNRETYDFIKNLNNMVCETIKKEKEYKKKK